MSHFEDEKDKVQNPQETQPPVENPQQPMAEPHVYRILPKKTNTALKVTLIVLLCVVGLPILLFGACMLIINLGSISSFFLGH